MNDNTQYLPLDFAEEMKSSFLDYAMSVIIARALPDVRDGLKPVQRRILYAMDELGLDPKKPHRKSARIVGDTMGKYHPHGDSSIYEGLVHMSEWFSMQVPLVDGHGNFGSIDGDPAAAMRYTEARLSEGAMTMLEHLDQGLVDFIPNFDESEDEPVVLPATFPNLIVNGSTGIAVGMATNIPTHNPCEVIDGIIACIDKPNISTQELMEYIPGPDFPTGGTIVNADCLETIYETGEGKLRIRANTIIENGEYGRKNIIVTEIPFTAAGSKTRLVENLAGLVKDKVFEEIYDVRDESSQEGIRIVIEVKKDRDIDNLLNGLYKKTGMEDTYSVNLLAVKEKQPYTFGLKSLITEFIDFQELLYTKEYTHRLIQAQKRLEIVEGLVRAVDVIDLIIEILRGSSSVKQAKDCLTSGQTKDIRFKSDYSRMQATRLDFTERQADAILAMQLQKLVGLELKKLSDEGKDLENAIDEFQLILRDRMELFKVIKSRLREYKKAFPQERRTKLCNQEIGNYFVEEKIEDVYILVDRFGYMKCVDSTTYSRAGENAWREYTHILPVKNNEKLCVFTAEGNMFQIKATQVPRCKPKDKGTLIHNLCKLEREEPILFIGFNAMFDSQLLFVTQSGYVKQVSGIEFETVRSCIAATKLDVGDKLAAVIPMLSSDCLNANQRKVILLTKSGVSLGFQLSEVSEMKRTGRGVKGITLDARDRVTFAALIRPDNETYYRDGKEYSAKKIKCRKRGAKGSKISSATPA